MRHKILTIKQLDAKLEAISTTEAPKQGWIRTIRNAINMTLPQLAKRLGVARSRVIRIEQDEPSGKVTLQLLEKAAECLNCKLFYAFVPKDNSFEKMLERQARKIAKEQVKRTSHTMSLEEQTTSETSQQEQVEYLTQELLQNSWKHLWKDK